MNLTALLLLFWLPFHLGHAQADFASPQFCGKKVGQKLAKTAAKSMPRQRAKGSAATVSRTQRTMTGKHAAAGNRPVAGKSRPAARAIVSRRGHFTRFRPVKQYRTVIARSAPVLDPSQPPALYSHAALVMRHDTGEVLYAKNVDQPHSIASVTKLMTAIVVMEQNLAMDEHIRVSESDVDTLKNSSSRLPVGTSLSREELLLLALMSSENRAASALARTSVPGGLGRFVAAMNRKAQALGMQGTRFMDPTGLNPGNVSTAADLAKMAQAAYQYPLIRRMTTTAESEVYFSNRFLPTEYRNTNSLVRNQTMAVGLSKTGYIREAGRCLVMQANLADDPYLLVFLGSPSHSGPAQDAVKLERWLSYRRQVGG